MLVPLLIIRKQLARGTEVPDVHANPKRISSTSQDLYPGALFPINIDSKISRMFSEIASVRNEASQLGTLTLIVIFVERNNFQA